MPKVDRGPSEPIAGLAKLSLCDLIVRLSPQYRAPHHLAPLPSLLEGAIGGNLRVLASPPVRHAKTTTVLHAFPYWLLRNPRLELFYLTFDLDFAQRNSRSARRLTVQSGIVLSSEHNTIKEWRTDAGGTCFFGSLGQEIQGRGTDVAVFDDALGWLDRHDPKKRDEADDAITFIYTRLNPGGSIFVIGSRSGRDDPIGRRLSGRVSVWMHVAMPAIIDEGAVNERALWPEGRPLANLKDIRAELTETGDQSVWMAQYQGEPIADAAGVFVGLFEYDATGTCDAEWANYGVVVGIDAAFSKGRRADWFAAIPMAERWGKLLLIDAIRHQRGTIEIVASLSAIKERFPRCRLVSYVSGPEIGTYDLLFEQGFDIERMPAKWNKGVRARATAHSWNKGNILVPKLAPWKNGYVARTHSFSGVGEEQDDEQDATVAGHDGIRSGKPVDGFGGGFMFGKPVV